jgi:cyclophilin family peptidyl-prolyl cis-trans isomerase
MRWPVRLARKAALSAVRKTRRRTTLRIDPLEPRDVPSVTGLVFKDANGNGLQDSGESGIGDVTVQLFQGTTRVGSVTTAADGSYTFDTIDPSTAYQLRVDTTQTALAGLSPSPANQGSDDVVDSDFVLNGTTATVDFTTDALAGDLAFDAGFAATPASAGTASLAGRVFLDFNNSGTFDGPDTGVSGVTVTLSGGGLTTPVMMQTDTAGDFTFTGLAAGTYTLTETQPTAPANQTGKDTAGTASGTTTTANTISGITVTDGQSAAGYLFAEIPLVSTGGTVYQDQNSNGLLDTGEPGIQGVTVTLTGTSVVNGTITPIAVTTNAQGVYTFPNLTPGTYTIAETQPSGFTDGGDQDGTPAATGGSNDTFAGINLSTTAAASGGFNFGEAATPAGTASIAGSVYLDASGDGNRQGVESGISGVTIHLTGTDSQNQAVDKTTTTDTSGNFSFTGLAAGTYKLAETQPTTNADGKEKAGTAGGTTTTNDQISGITLTAGQTASGYLFGEGAAISNPGSGTGSASLAITQTLSSSVALPGTPVTITYKVRNRGTGSATAVEVNADLGGLTFGSASSSDFDPSTGTWTVGSLAAGATATLRITATMPTLGTFNLSATATGTPDGVTGATASTTGAAVGTISGATPSFWYLSSGWTTLRGLASGGGAGSQSTATTPIQSVTAPATPTVALAAASDTGTAGDNSTNLAMVTLTGTTTPGAAVTLVETNATATADATGAYSFASVPLTLGSNTFTVKATDDGGSSTGTATITRVDPNVTSPTTPTLALNAASDTGTAGDNSTDLATVTLVGTTTAGASVTLVQTNATATADAAGAFQFANVPLTVGANSFTVRATNTGGTTTGTATITRVAADAAPTVSAVLAPINLSTGGSQTVDLAGNFDDADIGDTMIRFDTSAGPVNVELFDKQAPKTVANFLNYVTAGDYTDSIFHRSAKLTGGTPFVLQGGGFAFNASPTPAITEIPTDPAVQNEPDAVNRSNVKGTLAMAKLGSDPNSATDQFFFNLGNNSANLDNQNGGFTVFGKVVSAADQTVVDQLAAMPTKDESAAAALPASQQGVFGEIPLQNYTGTNFPTDTTKANYAIVNGVSIVSQPEALTYSIVGNTNASVATVTVTNNRMTVHANTAGTTTVTVQATDKSGKSVTTTVRVTVS